MKKNSKMFLGLASIFIAFIIGYVIWLFAKNSLYMKRSELEAASLWLLFSAAPALILYAINYYRLLKVPAPKRYKVNYNFAFWIGLTSVLTFAEMFIPAFVFTFTGAMIYIIISGLLISVASAAAYIVFKPY